MRLLSAPVYAACLALWLAQASPKLTPEVMAKPAQLFPVAPATVGAGPAVVEYWLDGVLHRVQLTVVSAAGARTATLVPRQGRGVNVVKWDLRIVPAGIDAKEVRKEAAKNLPMPFALPGDYTVHLNVDGTEQVQALRVNDDPRLTMTPAERKAWTDTQVSLWQTAYGAEQQRDLAIALGEQSRLQAGAGRKATAASLKKLEEPLEEIAEHAEGLLKKVVVLTKPAAAADIAKANEYAAALEKRKLEVRALQDVMRGRAGR